MHLLKISFIFISLILFTGVLWIMFSGKITASSKDAYFLNKLAHEEKNNAEFIKVSSTTNFEWDTVCLFYGYDLTPSHEQLKEHGVDIIPSEYENTIQHIEETSDIRAFVFSQNGAVNEIIYIANTWVDINGNPYWIEGPGCEKNGLALFKFDKAKNGKHGTLWIGNINTLPK